MAKFANEKLQRLMERLLEEKPEAADAIVWLQGDQLDRGPKVWELFTAGFAPTIVITGNNVLVGKGCRLGENDAPLLDLTTFLTDRGVPNEAIVVDDSAMNTIEQAKHIVALARAHGWQKILLVTSPYHQARAYLTFEKIKREAGSALTVVNQPVTDLSWDARPSGRDKMAHELLTDEERKISSYDIVREAV